MAPARPSSCKSGTIRKVRWIAVEVLLVVGAVLAGLYCGPRLAPPDVPAVRIGVPDRPVRFLAYNLYHNYRGINGTTAQVRSLQPPPPDFVMLEEAELDHLGAMSKAWGLPYVYHPPASARQPAGDWPGICLLSRYPLSDPQDLRSADGLTFGVWAYAVVDGRKFAVAALHLRATTSASPSHVLEINRIRTAQLNSVIELWRKAGSPPLVVGGDFNQPPIGENYRLMTHDFTDALAAIGKDTTTHRLMFLETRLDYLLVSKEWAPIDGGVIEGEASDHRPIWVELRAAPAGATRPAPPTPSAAPQMPSVPTTAPHEAPAPP